MEPRFLTLCHVRFEMPQQQNMHYRCIRIFISRHKATNGVIKCFVTWQAINWCNSLQVAWNNTINPPHRHFSFVFFHQKRDQKKYSTTFPLLPLLLFFLLLPISIHQPSIPTVGRTCKWRTAGENNRGRKNNHRQKFTKFGNPSTSWKCLP
ncbi:hypothetical protein BDP81DRAFT_198666 [Colletotrichum phormii]|uniref:Uncharacterized protein n=1 Tax=Colletotrichum phormii TaxID=359342 RepID=A0AAJ0EHF9_9PEZI|nr:uncharacterized protein BDP81DRAFT_198666 [Colletotrichum phormii]KAK1639203.1 hypothetical protein BDP81DRAFT_198666 [Colletotrichum phormii]